MQTVGLAPDQRFAPDQVGIQHILAQAVTAQLTKHGWVAAAAGVLLQLEWLYVILVQTCKVLYKFGAVAGIHLLIQLQSMTSERWKGQPRGLAPDVRRWMLNPNGLHMCIGCLHCGSCGPGGCGGVVERCSWMLTAD
jgi:hypothetical protein